MGYLSQQGVKPIEAIGKPFNTEEFEAIATIPAPEPDMKARYWIAYKLDIPYLTR